MASQDETAIALVAFAKHNEIRLPDELTTIFHQELSYLHYIREKHSQIASDTGKIKNEIISVRR